MEKNNIDHDEIGWEGFLQLCIISQDTEKLTSVFDLLLTFEERKNLSLRYLIIQGLLSEKETQRELAQRLGVSIAKITRGSNELKRFSPEAIEYFRKQMGLLKKL